MSAAEAPADRAEVNKLALERLRSWNVPIEKIETAFFPAWDSADGKIEVLGFARFCSGINTRWPRCARDELITVTFDVDDTDGRTVEISTDW